MDLGDFEIGRNRGVNGDKLAFAAQKSEKLAQVVHGGLGREVEGRVGLEYIKAKFLKHPHSPQETINYENEEDV